MGDFQVPASTSHNPQPRDIGFRPLRLFQGDTFRRGALGAKVIERGGAYSCDLGKFFDGCSTL
eukprot:3876191-Amphidinium_carterae.1